MRSGLNLTCLSTNVYVPTPKNLYLKGYRNIGSQNIRRSCRWTAELMRVVAERKTAMGQKAVEEQGTTNDLE